MPARNVLKLSNRPDLYIKFLYANSTIQLGYIPEDIREAYLDSIRSFNDFYEEAPRKIGPIDFLQSFDALIASISGRGFQFSQNDEPIFLNSDLKLINGAHRVAVSAVLGLTLEFNITDSVDAEYDYEYFMKRGMNKRTLELSLRAKTHLDQNLQCVIVHGVVTDKARELIKRKLTEQSKLFYFIDIKLDVPKEFYLKYINYLLFSPEPISWQGDAASGFKGLKSHARKSFGNQPTSFYFLTDISQSNLIELKSNLRSLTTAKNFGVHSAETPEEVIEIMNFVTNDLVTNGSQRVNYDFDIDFLERLRAARKLLEDNCMIEHTIIGGSAVLEVFGLRKSRDLDIFIEQSSLETFELIDSFDISISAFTTLNLGSSIKELLLDPGKSFSLAGLNFISLSQLRDFKLSRAEYPKDYRDLDLIVNVSDKKANVRVYRKLMSLLKFRIWKIFSIFIFIAQKSKDEIVKRPLLFRAVKRIKNFVISRSSRSYE